MNRFQTLTALIVAAAAATTASAQETYTRFGETEGWTVFKINETGGCLVEFQEPDGDVFQMGVGKKGNDFGFIAFFTEGQTTLKDGETRPIILSVDGQSFTADAKGVVKGTSNPNYRGGYVLLNNPDLVSALANGSTLTVQQDQGIGTFELPLKGTKAAMEMGRTCLDS